MTRHQFLLEIVDRVFGHQGVPRPVLTEQCLGLVVEVVRERCLVLAPPKIVGDRPRKDGSVRRVFQKAERHVLDLREQVVSHAQNGRSDHRSDGPERSEVNVPIGFGQGRAWRLGFASQRIAQGTDLVFQRQNEVIGEATHDRPFELSRSHNS